jgi:hypothetical protein
MDRLDAKSTVLHVFCPALSTAKATPPWQWATETWERLGSGLFVVSLLAVTPWALWRMCYHGSDFPWFYAAGRYVLEHGVRRPNTVFSFYLPSVDAAWALLAWLPFPVAALVWYLIGCASWVGLLAVSARFLLANVDPIKRRRATLAAGLLVTPLAMDHLCLGAFHILMLTLMVAGLGRASRDRWLSGGILLGWAVWMKRKWKAAATAAGCAVLVDVVLSWAAFGPQAAWQYHQRWWKVDGFGITDKILLSPTELSDHYSKNQSLPAVLRRTLTPLRFQGTTVNLLSLQPQQVKRIYLLALGATTVALGWLFRRPGARTSTARWSTEIALVVLATIWYTPVISSYHPTAAAPCLAVLLSRGPRYRGRLVWLVPLLWSGALALLGVFAARACGELLWATAVLGVALVSTLEETGAECSQPVVGDPTHSTEPRLLAA